jgi:hypothetical protein
MEIDSTASAARAGVNGDAIAAPAAVSSRRRRWIVVSDPVFGGMTFCPVVFAQAFQERSGCQ